LDSLIICKFLRKCFTDFYGEAAELLRGVIGWDCSAIELRKAGERINTMKRLFNQREGWQPKDDWLPPRLLSEALPTGIAQGVALTASELREMISGYYQVRELDENGFVLDRKLRELEVLNEGMKSCQATKPGAY
jgi:aldehyde:ferredoxin oxidoreductase